MIFFNGYLLHRSFKNRSTDRCRRALVNHYCSAWSPLPWLVRDGIDIGPADYRVVVPVVGDDPYPERGIDTPPGKVFPPSHGGLLHRRPGDHHPVAAGSPAQAFVLAGGVPPRRPALGGAVSPR